MSPSKPYRAELGIMSVCHMSPSKPYRAELGIMSVCHMSPSKPYRAELGISHCAKFLTFLQPFIFKIFVAPGHFNSVPYVPHSGFGGLEAAC